MKSRLFYSKTSPYARKARIVAIETGHADELELVDVDVWSDNDALQGVNPLGKVPALITAEGDVVFDSTVICEHFGRSSTTGWCWEYSSQTMTRHALAQGIVDAALAIRLEYRFREPAMVSQFWLARWTSTIARSLDAFESGILPDPRRFQVDAVSLLCALSYLSLRKAALQLPFDWTARCPSLALWHDAVSERPSVVETAP